MNETIDAIGVMSGTSLDGLDVALCRFTFGKNGIDYKILDAQTFAYSNDWQSKLGSLQDTDAHSFCKTHLEFGHYIGKICHDFITVTRAKPSLISSHGHTVFHEPAKGLTIQIGSGAAIAAETGITTACDFRSSDVALGGQGAPLVPIGDQLLFSEYSACINLGGFSNISFEENGHRKAFDICPVNIVLNQFARILGHEYDNSGNIARSGKEIPELTEALNQLDYYSQPSPKSLGREWVERTFLPIVHQFDQNIPDLLRSVTDHIAIQISQALPKDTHNGMLFTGGGVYNDFLMERIAALSPARIIIPDSATVDFKEALIFALLGVLRVQQKVNCISGVTGASRDSVSGAVYMG